MLLTERSEKIREILEISSVIFLYKINLLVFLTEMPSILWEVQI